MDIYTVPLADTQQGVTGIIGDLIPDDLPEPIAGLIEAAQEALEDGASDVEELTDPLVEEADKASSRAGPTKAATPEPNAADDNSLTMSALTDGTRCDEVLGLTPPGGESKSYYNLMDVRIVQDPTFRQANFDGVTVNALKDPTALDGDGLPAESDEQSHNPWHPGAYKFDGLLNVFLDGNSNGQFDACPVDQGDGPSPDLCVADLDYDMYEASGAIGDSARDKNMDDPTGLYFVLKVTGPVATYDVERSGDPDETLAASADRTVVMNGDGLNCIVGTTTGLLDLAPGDLFRELNSLSPSATDEDVAADLCGEDADDVALIKDAFATQSQAGGTLNDAKSGKLASAVGFVKTGSNAAALNNGPGDGLTVTAVLSIQDGEVHSDTSGNINLGDNPATLETTLSNGADVYVWTDHEPFVSTVSGS